MKAVTITVLCDAGQEFSLEDKLNDLYPDKVLSSRIKEASRSEMDLLGNVTPNRIPTHNSHANVLRPNPDNPTANATGMTDQMITFLERNGCACPACGGSVSATDSIDDNGDGNANTPVTCDDCDATWTEDWTLNGFSDLELNGQSATRELMHALTNNEEECDCGDFCVCGNCRDFDTENKGSAEVEEFENLYWVDPDTGIGRTITVAQDATIDSEEDMIKADDGEFYRAGDIYLDEDCEYDLWWNECDPPPSIRNES